ncbi:adenosylcobinamide amidohydrolase [Halococcoides cellulosivorans]|uniref:Adenosylcobinamide amidohydrolase n=1 Tax=Halococcoides cellulosivorans TaxID=1679096 RepID=A0A2R4X138_9EURY|nr:adenosylcobinamide amidohydrolase [Halococcoides cellulosivorans]AWB27510.1 adenosylcobinamide amidohydrolase [Halococcoides cellulosivorans]
MPEIAIRDGVCRVAHEGSWLVTGPLGGQQAADGAAIVSVPADWSARDLDRAARARLARAGFDHVPTLFTAVDVATARGARLDGVCVIATAGLTNPAALPLDPSEADDPPGQVDDVGATDEKTPFHPGTVNLVVTTDRALAGGTQATLLATVVEAKTATLHALTGFTGTTSDAVAIGSDRSGPDAAFAGAATPVGDAARACVREAVRAALAAGDRDPPASVATADAGARTDRRAEVFDP